MKTSQIVAVCVAVVLVVGVITAGIVYGVRQGTQRRETCVKAGGSWLDDKCLFPSGRVQEF